MALGLNWFIRFLVALRKESVDRNTIAPGASVFRGVALRKESVDRNGCLIMTGGCVAGSLSARRAWIEMYEGGVTMGVTVCRSPQGERG